VENRDIMHEEEGRVKAFHLTADAMGKCMDSSQTDPDVVGVILEYVKEWGRKTMEEICRYAPAKFRGFAAF